MTNIEITSSGNVWDKPAIEGFFSSFKKGLIGKKIYLSQDQAKAEIFDYIERFYNPTQRYSTLGYLSPIDFELKQRQA